MDWRKLLAFSGIAITIFLTVCCFSTRKNRREGWKRSVQLPFYLTIIGMACSGILAGLAMAFWQGSLFFIAFAALGWSLMLGYLNCYVRYDENGFLHKTLLGVKREYCLGDITAMAKGIHESIDRFDIKLYVGKHVIRLDSMCENRANFIAAVTAYRKKHGMGAIPSVKNAKERWDPFHHNIANGWLIFILFLIFTGFAIAGAVFMPVTLFAPPDTPETTTNQEVTLIGAEWDGGSVLFQSRELLKSLRVDNYKSYGTFGNPMDMCDGKTVCTLPDQKRRRLKNRAGTNLWTFKIVSSFQLR